MTDNKPDRIKAEKEFHNARFADGQKHSSRYYLALQYWYSDYFLKVSNVSASRVLELGCGAESLSMQIDDAAFELDSIDISEEAVDYSRANTRLANARFSVDDAHHTRFSDASFDLVIGRGILHHLDISTSCAEIRRVLKPGGKVVFGEPLDCNFLINLYRKLTPNIRTRDEKPLSREDLDIISSHFDQLEITYYGFLTLGPAVLGLQSPHFLHILDDVFLNKLGMGRYLAWACLLFTPEH